MTVRAFVGQYAFLSNFYRAPVMLDGVGYPTVEHAYQAAKTGDPKEREWVRSAPSPGEAKRRGRRVHKRPDFDGQRLSIMAELLVQKFNRYWNLRAALLSTGDEWLVEGNTWGDRYWGQCKGEGANHLGELLMMTRQAIKEAQSKKEQNDDQG